MKKEGEEKAITFNFFYSTVKTASFEYLQYYRDFSDSIDVILIVVYMCSFLNTCSAKW